MLRKSTFSKPQMSQQNIWAHGWVLIMIFPSFWAFVAKYSLPFIALRLKNTASSDKSLTLITNCVAPVCSSYCTSLSPASSACGHHSWNGYQWRYSWDRPRWWVEQKEFIIIMKVMRLCMYMCLQTTARASLWHKSNMRNRLISEIEKKTCLLEMFGDESWVRDLSWYGGNHQCPGYLQHRMQPPWVVMNCEKSPSYQVISATVAAWLYGWQCRSVGPALWHLWVKCLYNYWMNCYEIWSTHSCSPQDNL